MACSKKVDEVNLVERDGLKYMVRKKSTKCTNITENSKYPPQLRPQFLKSDRKCASNLTPKIPTLPHGNSPNSSSGTLESLPARLRNMTDEF